MNVQRIVLLTGERQIGKSTLCLELARRARHANMDVSGLVTLRTGPHDLEVTEIRSGASYPLTLPFDGEGYADLKNFRMSLESLARSASALDQAFPTEIFILDEIGPLELKREEGWVKIFTLLKNASCCIAFIVVRPELVVEAICRLPISFYTVIHVTQENRDDLAGALLLGAQKVCRPEM